MPNQPMRPTKTTPDAAHPDPLRKIWRGVPPFGEPHARRDPLDHLAQVTDQHQQVYQLDGCTDDPELVPFGIGHNRWRISQRLGISLTHPDEGESERFEEARVRLLAESASYPALTLGARCGRCGDYPTYDLSDTCYSESQRHAVVIKPGSYSVQPTDLPCFYPQKRERVWGLDMSSDDYPPVHFDTAFVGGDPDPQTAAAIASLLAWPFTPHAGPGVFLCREARDNPAVPTVAQRIKAVLDPDELLEPCQNSSDYFTQWKLPAGTSGRLQNVGVIYIDLDDWGPFPPPHSWNPLREFLEEIAQDPLAPMVLLDTPYRVDTPSLGDIPLQQVEVRHQQRASQLLSMWTSEYRLPLLWKTFDLVAGAMSKTHAEPITTDVPADPPAEDAAVVLQSGPCSGFDTAIGAALRIENAA